MIIYSLSATVNNELEHIRHKREGNEEKLNSTPKEQEGTMKGYTNINSIYIKFKLMVLYMLYCIIILTRCRVDKSGENEE